jgi:hypothetical protein
MKYLEKSFSVGMYSKKAQENFDRIFRHKQAKVTKKENAHDKNNAKRSQGTELSPKR